MYDISSLDDARVLPLAGNDILAHILRFIAIRRPVMQPADRVRQRLDEHYEKAHYDAEAAKHGQQ